MTVLPLPQTWSDLPRTAQQQTVDGHQSGDLPLADLSCHYFDPAVFAQPALGQLAILAAINSVDLESSMRIQRIPQFRLTERFTFQFRAEMFG